MLLFAQLAASAYACPRLSPAAAHASATGPATPDTPDTPATPAMAAMPDCHGQPRATMDPAQPQLCHAHCEQGSQTVSPAAAQDAPAAPLLLAVLDWSAAAMRVAAAEEGRAVMALSGAPPPGAPPLYLRLLVLRN